MKIVVSGASGLVGGALVDRLRIDGHQVCRLVRRPAEVPDEACWDPAAGTLDAGALEGAGAVVHLAGENISRGRWTRAFKRRILDSRVLGTKLIAEAVALADPPPALVSASAIGIYGDRGEEAVSEQSPVGEGFLADVCRQWEAATLPAADAGARVVNLRIGMVLSRYGGALARMLTPFRLGMGGVIGNGRQAVSWIHLEDLVGVVGHALAEGDLSGPVNAVSPRPVTNRELTAALGRVLRRPTVIPLPAAMVRLIFGEMGDALLLASTRVEPRRLLGSGFSFRFPDLAAALGHELPNGGNSA
ncbi:MAG: TIGR01777 family protein [bacterium]|nr:TIGR01777 family protein [bacterium]